MATCHRLLQGPCAEHADFASCALQRVGRTDAGHGIGANGNGLLVAEKAILHKLVPTLVLGLEMRQHVQAEIAVEVAAVAPVHVEHPLVVQPVEHKGVSPGAHQRPGVVHRPALHNFRCDVIPIGSRGILVTVQVMHILQAESPLQRFDQTHGSRAALAHPPVHPAGHAQPV